MSFPLLDSTIPIQKRRVGQLLLSAFAFFLIAMPASADFGTVHSVVLMPGLEEVEVPLAGWVVPDRKAYTVQVLDAPRFGTWTNEVFRPDDAFWEYGGDRVILSITSGYQTATHTIVLRAVRPYDIWRMREGFEASGGVLSSTNLGQIGDTARMQLTSDALDGLWSLEVDLSGGGAALLAEEDGGVDITGIDQMGGKAAVNPDLPGGGGGGGGGGFAAVPHLPFVLFELNDAARAQLRFREVSGQTLAEVRAEIDDAEFGCAPTCTTPWRPIPMGSSTAVGLWHGRDLGDHPSPTRTSVHLVIETPDPNGRVHDTISGLPSRRFEEPKWTVGAVAESSTGVPGKVRLDLLESWWQAEPVTPISGPVVIAEDVSGGSFDPVWQIVGPVTPVMTNRDLANPQWAARIDLDDVKANGSVLLVDDGPHWTNEIRVEMQAGLAYATLGEGMAYTIWGATTVEGTVGSGKASQVVAIDVATLNGARHARAQALDDAGVRHTTRWLPVAAGNAETPIILEWWRRSGGLDGGLRLMVGGTEARLDGLDNASQVLREHGVGAWDVRTEGRSGFGFSPATPFLLLDDVLVIY